jgi:hypothetical protein
LGCLEWLFTPGSLRERGDRRRSMTATKGHWSMSLAENTKTALDESRTLMLGAQILLGFQLQAPFQSAFVSLMWHEKAIEVAVLCIMVLVLGLLIAPSARHRIVEQGEATAGINRFICPSPRCFPSRSRLRSISSSPERG